MVEKMQAEGKMGTKIPEKTAFKILDWFMINDLTTSAVQSPLKTSLDLCLIIKENRNSKVRRLSMEA